MKKEPVFNFKGEIVCNSCPFFYPAEAPCLHKLASGKCPTREDVVQWGAL